MISAPLSFLKLYSRLPTALSLEPVRWSFGGYRFIQICPGTVDLLPPEDGIAAAGASFYLADHPSTALLERLVHMNRDHLPATFRLLRVLTRGDVFIDAISVEQLPTDWRDRPVLTQQLGNQWLRQAANALVKVPSVIVPGAQNYLLNPAHADATKIAVREIIEAPFDPRLFR